MVGKTSQTGQQLGKLVALEGNIETISTQLRLLPPSSKILVIPSILEDLPAASEDSVFNARAFVRDVHKACGKRKELAQSFLQQSTPSHPRLVFMNGGSISAQATCISKIYEKATNGHIGEAEAVFTDIIKDGVAGLMRQAEPSQELKVQEAPSRIEDDQKVQEWPEDPSTIAMKAADSLDRATAALQSSEAEEAFAEVDAMPKQPIEANEPSEAQQVPPEIREDVFTSANGERIVRSVIALPAGEERRSFIPRIGRPKHYKHQKKPSITPSLIIYEDYTETLSTGADSLLSTISAPVTPHNVVFGEACLVDVQSASLAEKRIRRVTSVDRFYPSNSRVQGSNPILQGLQQRYSTNVLDVRSSTLAGKMHRRASHSEFETLPRTTFVRAFQTTIRRTPTLASPIRSASPTPPRVFVDRGTDAFWIEPTSEAPESANSGAFEPVFTVFEDLIIHFADDSENEIFESVIRSCKNGYSSNTSATLSESLRPVDSTSLGSRCPECHSIVETDDKGHTRRHESDPYRTSLVHDNIFGSNTKPLRVPKHKVEPVNEPNTPPTPASTPPPSSYGLSQRFHEFPANSDTAIDIQNSLRSVLEKYLPTGEYSQHYFAINPESDRLWKPVFRSDIPRTKHEGRTVDQILAFGCERGVSGDFFAELSGQVERLGTKKSGISRSGRLDLRYLIANAIQAFVARPLSSQTTVDPLFDPTLLATLIIPHLETYLVTNTQTRFLILHYSSTQLPIILALRDLVGPSLFKVAGILDSLSSGSPSFGKRRPQTPTKGSPLARGSNSSVGLPRTTYQKHTKSLSSISFSEANYLLPSTATDSEITNFLSVIWKSLIETDSFYNPEPESPAASKSRRTIHNSTTTTTDTPSPPLSKIASPKTPPQTPKSHLSSRYAREHQEAPNKIQQRQSKSRGEKDFHGRPTQLQTGEHHHSSTSIRSTSTTASARERQSERDWANFYIGEEDSEDDAYDRMILGRAGIIPGKTVYGRKDVTGYAIPVTRGMTDGSVSRKRPINSKKALKWLGLA